MTREPINNWCHIFAVFCWDPKPLVLSEMPRPFDADWYLSALQISMVLLNCEIANSQCQQNLRQDTQTWTLGEPKWWTKQTTTSWVHSCCSGWIILQGEQGLKMRLIEPNLRKTVQSAKPKKENSISPIPILTKFCSWPHHFTQQLTIQKQNTLVTDRWYSYCRLPMLRQSRWILPWELIYILCIEKFPTRIKSPKVKSRSTPRMNIDAKKEVNLRLKGSNYNISLTVNSNEL